MISPNPEPGGPEKKRPSCDRDPLKDVGSPPAESPPAESPLAKPAPVLGIPNLFEVCAKGDQLLIHKILVRDPIAIPKAEAINLALWIVALSGFPSSDFANGVACIRGMTKQEIESSPEAHRQRHIELHQALDELAADWIRHTQALPSKQSVLELMTWANEQAQNPT